MSSSRTITFLSAESTRQLDAQDCSICLQPFFHDNGVLREPALQLDCGHVFGTVCLLQWLNPNGSCPLCRRQVYEQGPPEHEPVPEATPRMERTFYIQTGDRQWTGTATQAMQQIARRMWAQNPTDEQYDAALEAIVRCHVRDNVMSREDFSDAQDNETVGEIMRRIITQQYSALREETRNDELPRAPGSGRLPPGTVLPRTGPFRALQLTAFRVHYQHNVAVRDMFRDAVDNLTDPQGWYLTYLDVNRYDPQLRKLHDEIESHLQRDSRAGAATDVRVPLHALRVRLQQIAVQNHGLIALLCRSTTPGRARTFDNLDCFCNLFQAIMSHFSVTQGFGENDTYTVGFRVVEALYKWATEVAMSCYQNGDITPPPHGRGYIAQLSRGIFSFL